MLLTMDFETFILFECAPKGALIDRQGFDGVTAM